MTHGVNGLPSQLSKPGSLYAHSHLLVHTFGNAIVCTRTLHVAHSIKFRMTYQVRQHVGLNSAKFECFKPKVYQHQNTQLVLHPPAPTTKQSLQRLPWQPAAA